MCCMLKKCREGERYSRIPIFSEQEYKLAASPEICLMEKEHPTLNTEHYCTQTEYFCALNFKVFLFLNVFLMLFKNI
jgi:hypothetical protein